CPSILIIFGVLLFIRPLFHTSSRSFLNQTILKETISYEDLVGTWKSVLSEPKLNKELIYIFTFTPGGACTLDYNNKDLTFNVDSKYFYDMKCFFRDGRLFYRPVVIK
ncbi:MAG: hypothetical protein KDD62_14285, partial [Bdellovibrionales bacterium]|nr:hypothetical protein [Bdellovibrionales bacterium]